ncbi:MAG: hypothetical protein A3K10_18050 [Bacteroidetes bacterium RIFCSPLOWO2_12_FULL_31_6]|nr:MAG: hypothetical protein A3K10_18050 [Bacteroidetes bacterium RIFCSPLOWO2_12_FULL_31_6]
MKSIIKTKPFNFSINLIEIENYCSFEIIAVSNNNKTKSSITNLNFIISELIEPIIAFENYESTIQINKNIGNGIYNNSIKLFNDSEWLNYLFNVLEDDITAGEWAK